MQIMRKIIPLCLIKISDEECDRSHVLKLVLEATAVEQEVVYPLMSQSFRAFSSLNEHVLLEHAIPQMSTALVLSD